MPTIEDVLAGLPYAEESNVFHPYPQVPGIAFYKITSEVDFPCNKTIQILGGKGYIQLHESTSRYSAHTRIPPNPHHDVIIMPEHQTSQFSTTYALVFDSEDLALIPFSSHSIDSGPIVEASMVLPSQETKGTGGIAFGRFQPGKEYISKGHENSDEQIHVLQGSGIFIKGNHKLKPYFDKELIYVRRRTRHGVDPSTTTYILSIQTENVVN